MIILLSIIIAGLLGFFILPLSKRIILRYPGTWIDVICQKEKIEKSNFQLQIFSSALMVIITGLLLFRYPDLSLMTAVSLILFIFCLSVASVIDWKTNIIPDVLTIPMMLLSFLVSYDLPWISGGGTESAIAGVLGYVLPILIGIILYKKSKDSIGGGDLKLLALGGLWLGITGFTIAVVISAILSGLYSYKYKTKQIPYAPFFLVGTVVYLLV